MSPLTRSTEFVFEKNIKPGKPWEATMGIIGLGFDNQDINPAGVYGKFAFKFIREPDFYMQRMQYAHILKGAYFASKIALWYVAYDTYKYYSNYQTQVRKKAFGLAVLLKLGKQWIFDNSFLLDIYGGAGYGFDGDDYETLNFGFLAGDGEVLITGTAGVRTGWVFR